MSELERRVADVVQRLVGEGVERGVQVSVYRHGEEVVDVVAGDADDGRAVTSDTLFHVTSTGKGATSTVAHTLVADGALRYDLPIVEVWPVRRERQGPGDSPRCPDALRRCAGRAGGYDARGPLQPGEDVRTDPWCDAVVEPGTRTGYHPQTYGFVVGEVVRRAPGQPISPEDPIFRWRAELRRPSRRPPDTRSTTQAPR